MLDHAGAWISKDTHYYSGFEKIFYNNKGSSAEEHEGWCGLVVGQDVGNQMEREKCHQLGWSIANFTFNS